MAQSNPNTGRPKTTRKVRAKLDVAAVESNPPLNIKDLSLPKEKTVAIESQEGEAPIGTPQGVPKADTDMPKPIDVGDFKPEEEKFGPTEKKPATETPEEGAGETASADTTPEEQEAEAQEGEQQPPEEPPQDNESAGDDAGGGAENEPDNEEKLKLVDRAKKFYLDKKKAAAAWIKNNISKAGAKAAGKAIWAFIVAFWPYVLAALVIIVLIAIIASSCSKGSGKTPYDPLDKVRDKKLVLQFRAAAKDKAAQRELIADEAMAAKDALKKINTGDNAQADNIIAQINKLLDEIVALADSPEAVSERVKQILALLDQLKQLLPDQAGQIDQIKNQISGIQKMLDYYKQGHLVVNPKDLEYVTNFDADRRVVQMLVYLVTPKDQGGAGHERIRVKRIKFSYDTERKSVSKETDYSEKDEPNISAHFSGQAADIAEIDCIKCTQIKRRRVGGSTRTKLSPIPIQVAWQTDKGFAESGGPDAFGQNMHQIFNNLGNDAYNEVLVDQLSEILGVDLDPAKIKGRSFQEIARYVGGAVLKESLGVPGDYELGNNLEDMANNVGRAYLAQALNVPYEGIRGSTPEELNENIGRATLESRMNLLPGSLEGASSETTFASLGRRKMEDSLHLSRGTLSISCDSQDKFKQIIGQGRIESSLGLRAQTFYGNNFSDFQKRVGKELTQTTFANPEVIDNWLGIATGKTQDLLDGRTSLNDYNKIVGGNVFDKQIMIYQDEGKRAEAFGVTVEQIQGFSRGDSGVYTGIGKTTLAQLLTNSDEEKSLIINWFNSGNQQAGLDEDYLGAQYGLKNGDLQKIFIDSAGSAVYKRVGQTSILTNLSQSSSQLSNYLKPVSDFQFYKSRLDLINDNIKYLQNNAQNAEIKAKAAETVSIVTDMLQNPSIGSIQKNTTQIQKNIKYIQDRVGDDTETARKVKEIQQAIDEIVEGKEISNYEVLSADQIRSQTDPQTGLTKKDIIGLLTGKKKVDDLVYTIGLKKWEIEFDLPDGSLAEAYTSIKDNKYNNPTDALLVSIGKARVNEYGGTRSDAASVDKALGLQSGATADYRGGKLTESAYYMKVGMGCTNNITAKIINQQFELNGDPNYALSGTDITKFLGGGWFYVALKIGGRGIDEALGFPAGGTADIISQSPNAGNIIELVAEKKLGVIAGLDHPVSIGGDINFNLGRTLIEQQLNLKYNELTEGNVVEKVRGYTGGDEDSLSRLDATLGLAGGTSKKLLDGGISPHDYIVNTGNYLRDSVIYDQIAKNNDWLQDQDLRTALLGLAEKTGSPEDILATAGANVIGEMLGLDYPISIRGNVKDNFGQAKIEDRLGLKNNSFRDNIDTVIKINGDVKFSSAFYVEAGKLAEARKSDSDYWNDDHKNQAIIVDSILNIPSGSTKDFLTGTIDLNTYKSRVGQSSLNEVSVDKIADLLDLDDDYKAAANTFVEIINTGSDFSDPQNQQRLYRSLINIGSWNLDNKTKFDPGTWERILFIDPNNPDTTGIKNAESIVLEQGKKWLPRWLGMDQKYDSYVDIIYEQGIKNYGPAGAYKETEMVNAIKDVTGIPDDYDAKRFLVGDMKGGLTAWGAAQIVKTYNDEFGGQGMSIDYATAKKAYFNDPAGEVAIGDAAVSAAKQKAGVDNLSPEAEKTIRQEAIAQSRENAKKTLTYNAVDMQLHHLDKNIPAGFTQAMREGTSEQKWTMGLTYVGNYVHSENPDIPADILPDLQGYFDSNSPKFHDATAFADTTYGFLDGKMKDWFGDFIQPGTAKALLQYGKTGQLGQPNEQGTLAQIYADYGINVVANWADKGMKLPMGTTKMVYDYYTKYQAALNTYQEAKALNDTAKIKESEAALKGLEAEAITFVLNTVFQKQLLALDQSLGFVPGSSAMLVGMGVQSWITGAISPWTIGLFVLTNLFGVYRVDVTCTACGYYPSGNMALLGSPTQPKPENADPSCPLGEFNGKSKDSFKVNSVAAAQYKTNQLIGDVLGMGQALNDESLVPTQIMTMRQEDVDSYSSQLNDLYGAAGTRMNSGMWANELMWDHVHIGY